MSANPPLPQRLPTRISEDVCERAVFIWELHENTFAMPILPTEAIVDPYNEPETDSSLSILDLVDDIPSGVFIRGQEVGRPAEWQAFIKNVHCGGTKTLQIGLLCRKALTQGNAPVWAKVAYDIFDNECNVMASSGVVFDTQLLPFYAGTTCDFSVGTKQELQTRRKALIKDGILRIRLHLNIYKELATPTSLTPLPGDGRPVAKRRRVENTTDGFKSLLGSLENLWNTRESTGDITIKIGPHLLKVHRFILTGHSEVFRNMLDSGIATLEMETRIIEVNDISPEIMLRMLEFLYLGDATHFDWKNVDLICAMVYAAEKYWIKRLKVKCYQNLMQMMSVENFAVIAKVTFMYNCDKEFKDAVRHFYESNQVTLNGVGSLRKFAEEDFNEFKKLFFYRMEK